MTWRIHEHVMRAVIDNRIRGVVIGLVWLAGRPEPLQLNLQGNAWSDLAGRLIRVENAAFRPNSLDGLATDQQGVCGDLTAKRPGKIPTVLPEEWLRAHPRVPMPYVWGTGIYLEWFSARNGQVIIELMGCSTCVSGRAWQPTLEEQSEPAWCNLGALDDLLRGQIKR
jgi:hypothetical protein